MCRHKPTDWTGVADISHRKRAIREEFLGSLSPQITGSDINVHFFCLTTLSGGSEAGRGSLFTVEKKLKRGARRWRNLIDFSRIEHICTADPNCDELRDSSREGDGAVVTGKRRYEPCSRWCFLSRFAWLRCRLPTVSIAGSLWGWSIGFFFFASVFFNPLCFFFLCLLFSLSPHAGRQREPGAVC